MSTESKSIESSPAVAAAVMPNVENSGTRQAQITEAVNHVSPVNQAALHFLQEAMKRAHEAQHMLNKAVKQLLNKSKDIKRCHHGGRQRCSSRGHKRRNQNKATVSNFDHTSNSSSSSSSSSSSNSSSSDCEIVAVMEHGRDKLNKHKKHDGRNKHSHCSRRHHRDDRSRSRERSRGRSRGHSRGHSRGRSRGHSRGHSRGRSHGRHHTRMHSRSRSRSQSKTRSYDQCLQRFQDWRTLAYN
ncbi:serine/arginine-rich splicing factor 4-like [Teleopsis dalmanni]|uniref:serine/arginine-rich splicing factor 4-like n=1 Tax=Teleopsis dalmanni TaxID=139649 RepID=UPI0018CF5743|nr:serine/arginine-rich splicing factor 4-like [Teleopsis dalmanni]